MRCKESKAIGVFTAISLGILIVTISGFSALAEELGKVATVSRFKQAPIIDGVIRPGEWDCGVSVSGFLSLNSYWLDSRTGTTYFGFCGENLYFAVISELPPDGNLITNQTRRDSDVILDDGIEIWIDPFRSRRETGEDNLPYTQSIINSIGAIQDLKHVPGQASNSRWNGDWTVANTIDIENNVWICEASIPWKEVGIDDADAMIGKDIGVIISRNYKRPWNQATWFAHRGGFDIWDSYPKLRLTENAPTVHVKTLGKSEKLFDGKLELAMSVNNPGPARTVNVKMLAISSTMPDVADIRTLQLPAGNSADYSFTVPSFHPEAEHLLRIDITSADDDEIYLKYYMPWKAPGQDQAWQVRVGPDPDSAVRVAYYPSYNLMKVLVDTSRLDGEAEQVTSARVALLNPAGEKLLDEVVVWTTPPLEKLFDIPKLAAGEYTVNVNLSGYDKHDFVRKFQREYFPWEGNVFGITNKVYPPFEPMQVNGRDVSLIMRKHQVGSLGLWESVKASSNADPGNYVELLAAPIALKVNDGEVLQGNGRFTSTAGHQVVYEAQSKHPAVGVHVKTITEYDGCQRVELKLEPGSENQELNRLWLDIPLKDSLFPLFHVVTTSIRSNPAGKLHQGDGVIWDSRDFPDGNWYGNFLPYIWIGAEERGICWFADNDKGWVLDVDEKDPEKSTPSLELIRHDGILTLRVNLVQKPVLIEEPRQIVFGIMATPAKPMQENWRAIRFLRSYKDYPVLSWIGATYWGVGEMMTERYPLNGDLSILTAMQESRLHGGMPGERLKGFMQGWSSRNVDGREFPLPGGRWNADMNADFVKSLARGSIGSAGGAADYFCVYWEEFRGVSRFHPETQIFGNEWTGNFSKAWIANVPPSYIDFAVWYAAEFIRRGIGVYFDNTFPARNLDPVTSAAYELPNGEMQPSAGMWARRNYLRRIWTLHQQLAPAEGKPMMMLHMTNSHIVPYMVWNQSNLDLEMSYGPRPAQEKYSHDMLRAESIALQTGNLPLVLAHTYPGEATTQEQEIAEVTRLAAMMVHELKFNYGSRIRIPQIRERLEKMMDLILDFGYGIDDCEVYNYWQDEYPLAATDEQVKSLLLKHGNEVMIVLATWNSQPAEVKLSLNAPVLKVKRLSEAVNAETGERLPLNANTITVDLEGYGVRILHVR